MVLELVTKGGLELTEGAVRASVSPKREEGL